MSAHIELSLIVYVAASVVFAAVILYWVLYTRRMKAPRNVGTTEGIAMASQRKERAHRTGSF